MNILFFLHTKRCLLAFAFFLIFFFGWGCPVFVLAAGQPNDEMAAPESYLLEKINQARRNPSLAMVAMGLDPEQIIEEMPDLRDAVRYGLPTLSANSMLSSAAKSHTAEMFKKNYYGYKSADGKTVYERVEEAGYRAAYCVESLGMVRFQNYLPKTSAVDFIFKNMFLDELDPGRDSARIILSPLVSEIGIGFGAGMINVNGLNTNAYITTIDLGTREISASLLSKTSLQIIQLVNQARREPLLVLETEGRKGAMSYEAASWLLSVFEQGLPTLRKSNGLTLVAEKTLMLYADGLLESDNGEMLTTLVETIRSAGYSPEKCKVRFYTIQINAEAYMPDNWSSIFFRNIISTELNTDRKEQLTAFGPDLQDIGVSVMCHPATNANGSITGFVLSVSLVYGVPEVPGRPAITGLVYKDTNADGIYTPGEGLAGQRMVIYGAGLHLITDETGGVQSAIEPGKYWAILFGDDGALTVQDIMVENRNEPAIFVFDNN